MQTDRQRGDGLGDRQLRHSVERDDNAVRDSVDRRQPELCESWNRFIGQRCRQHDSIRVALLVVERRVNDLCIEQ